MSLISRRSVLGFCASAALAFVAVTPVFADMIPFTAQAFQDAENANKSILIEIHASWCPTCKQQKAILNNLLLPEPKFKDMVVLRVDFDSQKGDRERIQRANAINAHRL